MLQMIFIESLLMERSVAREDCIAALSGIAHLRRSQLYQVNGFDLVSFAAALRITLL